MFRICSFLVLAATAGCDGGVTGTPGDGGVDDPAFDASEDGALLDAAIDAAIDAPPLAPAPVILYEAGRRHSPITPALMTRLQAIAASTSHDERVFAKVGDSISAATEFMTCFDGSTDLGNQSVLAATISHFRAGNAAGTSPFARTSRAALGGAKASDVMVSPSRLQQEITEINPRFSVVMFGTNDVRDGLSTAQFAADLWAVTDASIGAGVIPILSTIPSLAGDPEAGRVPSFNLVIRAIAQGRGVPLVDLFRELAPLPDRGLSADDVHPSSAPAGACVLTDAALLYGYNMRNLLTLEALARVRSALAGSPSEASASTRSGSGTAEAPFVGSLPLLDLGDTRTGVATIGAYPCNATPQSGREIVYRLDLATSMTIEVNVIDRGGVDAHVHVLAGAPSAASCVASGNPRVSTTVGPGPVYVVVDAPTAAAEGEYLLVVERR